MTEDDARSWIKAQFGLTAVSCLERIVGCVTEEASRQNLIASSTLASIWVRHIVDSAQLLSLLPPVTANDVWIDIGSGAGFPGMVIAALTPAKIFLVEPRRRRADFLATMISELEFGNRATVTCAKMESVRQPATIISARAVGHLCDILDWSAGCADRETRWVLPKGRSAHAEVASATKTWHGTFHVERSITDPQSLIIMASGIARR